VAGHRGAMAHAPENTALGLVTAEQLGVDEIEIDVRVSADGVAVISHDDDLSRVLGVDVAPSVSGSKWCDLQRLRLPRGQRLLSLPEVLDLTESDLQIELKDPGAAAIAAEVLAEYPDDQRRCSFTSFDAASLAAAQELLPWVPRGLIAEAYEPALPARAQAVQATWIYSGWTGLTPSVVADLHRKGFKVGAWLLRTADDARLACQLGVEKITADAPAEAREWIDAAAEANLRQARH
jgi:glycerophosphoryl diester phosphodiesterase